MHELQRRERLHAFGDPPLAPRVLGAARLPLPRLARVHVPVVDHVGHLSLQLLARRRADDDERLARAGERIETERGDEQVIGR